MSFNELNTVEHFIIHRLTGVNLNNVQSGMVAKALVHYDTVTWKYVQSELLQRCIEDVLLEKELTDALCRLNPKIAAQPERAEEVIHKLRAILITVNNVGLVRTFPKILHLNINSFILFFSNEANLISFLYATKPFRLLY